MQTNKINIAIVDDHPIVIEGLKAMLTGKRTIAAITTFSDGKGILSYIRTNNPDIVLLDVSLPDFNGIELCKEIKKINSEIGIIMLSNHSERSIIMQCIQNGASGYMLKNASVGELTNGIKSALSGNIVFCNEVKKIISKPSAIELQGLPRLTKREKEILSLLSAGKTSTGIAEELFLSPLTVDTHRKNMLQKFGVKNAPEMITIALEHHLI